MTTAPPEITAVIAQFEAELRAIETRGGLLRDTITSLRQIWDVSPLASSAVEPPPVQFTPALSEQLKQTPTKPAAAPKFETYERAKRAPAGDREAAMMRVLKAAATLPQPFRMAQLHMKVSDINRNTLTDYVAAFVAAKALTRTGERAGTKYAVASNVDVSRLPAPAAAPTAAAQRPAASTVGGKELAIATMSVLASGASYEVRDLLKGLRNVDPNLQPGQLEPVLDALVQARRVERIGVAGGSPRYRKRAA